MQQLTSGHNGIHHLALSELHTCQNYYHRLFYAIIDASEMANIMAVRSWASTFNFQAALFIKKNWLGQLEEANEMQADVVETISLFEAKENTKHLFTTLEGIIELGLCEKNNFNNLMAQTLNFLYLHARRLHLVVKEYTPYNVDLPRVILMDMITTEEGIPAYRVNPDEIFTHEDMKTPIHSLQGQRHKKYDQLINQGQKWIASQEYDLGRESFFKALNYKETAEAYNLIGWTYSLEKNFETAKNFCLKAIKVDPAHGASYNDLGSYLLSEGQTQESLKWFELAKNSRNYQNREYPYINAGRAYMNLRDYNQALEEFSIALTLTPHNEELHQTVGRLKETLNKGNLFATEAKEVPPPLF